jgi:hypothetical protein
MADRYYRRREAGEYLRKRYRFAGPWALAHLASEGPPYRLLGKFAVYRESDLDAWALRRLDEAPTRFPAVGTARAEAAQRKDEQAEIVAAE